MAAPGMQRTDRVAMTTIASNNLRIFRERKGLTGTQLGNLAGTTAATVSRLEKGHREMTEEWMAKFARVLGVHPSQFLMGETQQDEFELLNAFRQIQSAEAKRAVLLTAKAMARMTATP